jgi:branched-subunit amino acid aminotransferase/4-amino-4-deoxychorismate lyase
LHYASCVFEGERVYGGEVFKLTEHSQHLIDSATVERAIMSEETAKATECSSPAPPQK